MNDPIDHDDPIEEAAADWLTLHAEGFSSAQKRDFDRWCRADPRHAAALARLEAVCALLEKMPLVRAELQPVVVFPAVARSARAAAVPVFRGFLNPVRVALALGLGLAAAVALVFLGARQFTAPANNPIPAQIFTTSAGGYERVALADGSVVELNADTDVRVVLTPKDRRVELVAGEAHFTVAHDRARPFIVAAGGVAVRAVGTAFNVRLATTAVEVLVTQGKVSVSEVERVVPNVLQAPVAPTLLAANERTFIPTAPATAPSTVAPAPPPIVERIAPEAIREALAWQERKLAFAETPLRDVVAQFNRRNRLQLVIGDPSLAERPVGGTFAADNVEGFVRLLENSGTIAIERRDELTVILRAVR